MFINFSSILETVKGSGILDTHLTIVMDVKINTKQNIKPGIAFLTQFIYLFFLFPERKIKWNYIIEHSRESVDLRKAIEF